MTRTREQIISASRRTDIPAWYTPWFLDRIRDRRFDIRNPFSGQVRTVEVRPDNTHSIVFWSKNYHPFLDLGADRILRDMGFRLYFNFTVNSVDPLLEPALPGLARRIAQAGILADRFGPQSIAWRFDPICFYMPAKESNRRAIQNNLKDFRHIADQMSDFGMTKCVTSFYDSYRKVDHRIRFLAGRGKPAPALIDPSLADKVKIIREMAVFLGDKQMNLHLCCESTLMDAVADQQIPARENACVDGRLLKEIYGGNPVLAKDAGQRTRKGCRCTKSVDVGDYQAHPCGHDCLFCYANTRLDTEIFKKVK